jgi:hypothetical protein
MSRVGPGSDWLLPAVPDDLAQPSVPRSTNLQVVQIIPGADSFSFSVNTVPDGNAREFLPLPGALAWAMYRLEGVGPLFVPQSLQITTHNVAEDYYLGLADYSTGSWSFSKALESGTTIDPELEI